MSKTPACTPTWIFHGWFGKPKAAKERFRRGLLMPKDDSKLTQFKKHQARILEELGKLSQAELENRQKAAMAFMSELESYQTLLDRALEEK